MAHTAEEIQKHVKIYMMVFAALAGLTLVTVAISYLDLTLTHAIIVALFVACVKASLVAAFFMHLISERKLIFLILAFTIFFLIFCLVVPTIVNQETLRGMR